MDNFQSELLKGENVKFSDAVSIIKSIGVGLIVTRFSAKQKEVHFD